MSSSVESFGFSMWISFKKKVTRARSRKCQEKKAWTCRERETMISWFVHDDNTLAYKLLLIRNQNKDDCVSSAFPLSQPGLRRFFSISKIKIHVEKRFDTIEDKGRKIHLQDKGKFADGLHMILKKYMRTTARGGNGVGSGESREPRRNIFQRK